MTAKLVIDRKRQSRALTTSEIREFVAGFTSGEIPDYQMSALAMAICCRGMTERETADLTDAMMRSGAMLDWGELGVATADKHSTGGVGDKLSLVIQPLAAACGVAVPSLVGRGLGLTGGTADKLESIPGFRVALTTDEFKRIVREVGVAMAVQTAEICPADKKLYALRDVTGTVASIPLIAASILSKKWAEGASSLVFDVKAGSGAFMKTREEAVELATTLVGSSRSSGRKAAALVTDMSSPLGFAVGNANEVAEAIRMLKGEMNGPEVDLSVELAALMVSLARDLPLDAARAECRQRLGDGSAMAKFAAMVSAQGGDLESFRRLLAKPVFRFKIQAMRGGFVEAIDAERVARVALLLGAGREKAGDRIDCRAGVTLGVRRGERVTAGQMLATLEKSFSPDGLDDAAGELYRAFSIVSTAVEPPRLIVERI